MTTDTDRIAITNLINTCWIGDCCQKMTHIYAKNLDDEFFHELSDELNNFDLEDLDDDTAGEIVDVVFRNVFMHMFNKKIDEGAKKIKTEDFKSSRDYYDAVFGYIKGELFHKIPGEMLFAVDEMFNKWMDQQEDPS